MIQQKTFIAKANNIERKWFIIDAKDKILGRVAAKAASVIRGKHKVVFTRNVDTGDHVIIINCDKVKVTGKKLTDKEYRRYSGYQGGLKVVPLEKMLKEKPAKMMQLAVNRMISRNPLGWKIRSKLKLYAGDKHPHTTQKPITLEV